MSGWLLCASMLTVAIWAVHTFIGGPTIARALLLATDLEAVPKWTQYYCWHVVTITLALLAAGLGYAAFVPHATDVALLIAVLTLMYAVFGLLLPPRIGARYVDMPQGFLFLPVVLLTFIGVLAR